MYKYRSIAVDIICGYNLQFDVSGSYASLINYFVFSAIHYMCRCPEMWWHGYVSFPLFSFIYICREIICILMTLVKTRCIPDEIIFLNFIVFNDVFWRLDLLLGIDRRIANLFYELMNNVQHGIYLL